MSDQKRSQLVAWGAIIVGVALVFANLGGRR